jgi:cytochrome c1
MKKSGFLIVVILLASMFLTACAPKAGSAAGTLDGKTLVAEKCSTCHSASVVTNESMNKLAWGNLVLRMIGHGLKVSEAEQSAIVTYLAQKYP